jgi:hypothetical protein
MFGRVIVPGAILALALMGAGTAAGATSTALPLQDAISEAPTSARMLFNPANAASLAQLDGMAANRATNVLAVCVGEGCTARTTEAVAAKHGWPFLLAWDADGSTSRRLLGTSAVPATIAPGRVATSPNRPLSGSAGRQGLLGRASQRKGAPGLSAAMSTPSIPRLVSARTFVMIGLPLMLLGLGGTAFVFVSRRNGATQPQQRSERSDTERLEQLVRERHGRKRPPVRS